MRHVKVEEQCVLCSEAQFDRNVTRVNDNGLDDSWQADVLRFLREPGPEVTAEYSSLLFRGPRVFRLRCTSSGWTYPNPQHDEFVAQHQLHLCRWGQACTACDPEYTVNLVHVQCYKLARLLFRNLCAVDLIQLARLTRPLLSEAFLPVSKAPIPPPPARLSTYTDLCYKTDLGCLVSEIQSRLPVELQHTIFYHTRGLFRSFTKCLDMIYTYSRLNHYASDTYQSNVQYPLQPYARPRHIGLTTVSIMGETCIAMIGSGGLRPWHDELQLSAAQPTGLQVAYGTFGLVQMRVLYIDGSVSPWMGGTSSSCKRFKTCRGRLEDMRVVHDGFKIIALELRGNNRNNTSPGVLWSDQRQPALGRIYSLIDVRLSESNVLGNPNSRVGLYLSLEGIRSLTVFCVGKGICSIQTNGDFSKRFGVENEHAVPLTFFFGPGEYITGIWSLSRGQGEGISLGPFLVMITSTGRTLFYGSNQVFYALLGADISRFDQREGKWRRPVGLFVDPTTATHSLLHSVGVALEEDKGGQGNHGTGVHHQTNHWLPLPGTISPDQRYFPRTHWQDCFLKRTNLTNARRLEVQTRGNRCVGLYIERHPGYGTPAILGQWDPADTESTRVIHDADVAGTQPLSALKFVFSDQKDITGRVCVDIVVGRGELFTGPVYTHDDLTQDVAWWFTYQHDFVESWHGRLFTVHATQGTEIPATMVDTHDEGYSLLSHIMRPFS